MTHTPLVRQLFEVFRKDLPPLDPQPLRPLPTARQGYPFRRTLAGLLYFTPPPRPSKPRALALRQAAAARLQLPGPPRLERPELHRRHDHPRLPAFVELVGSYVFGEAPAVNFHTPSPWERWVLAHRLDQLSDNVADNRWDQRWRLADLRAGLNLDRARDRDGTGRAD